MLRQQFRGCSNFGIWKLAQARNRISGMLQLEDLVAAPVTKLISLLLQLGDSEAVPSSNLNFGATTILRTWGLQPRLEPRQTHVTDTLDKKHLLPTI